MSSSATAFGSLTRGLLAVTAGAACGAGVVLLTNARSRAQVSGFWADVHAGMTEREDQLRVALGLDAAAAGARLDPKATHDLLDDPARWRAPTG